MSKTGMNSKQRITGDMENMPPPRLYMGPIRGVTDYIYRNTFADHFGGFDLAVAPFITSLNADKIPRKHVKDLVPENNTAMPVIPQILSKSAGDFMRLANCLYELGYETVNWNLGCPYPMVANKQRGSGLLPYTDRIHAFLDEAIPAIRGKLSIKTRLGYDCKEDIFRLIPVLNQYPIEEIIIHPRTGIQRYEGTVDLDAFEQCLSMTPHPIVYNGDIRNIDDFLKLSGRFGGISRWMIGRWSIADPFLPVIIKTRKDDILNKTEKMKQFHASLFDQYSAILSGPSHITDRMKGLWHYFSIPFSNCTHAIKKIKKARTPDQYVMLVNQFFDTEAKWRVTGEQDSKD